MSENKTQKGGIRIRRIERSSPFYSVGLRKDDFIFRINGQSIENDLEFSFYSAQELCEIEALVRGKKKTCTVYREPGELPGLDFVPTPMNRCRNRCIFCFIDQLPKGLRKRLYIKDEDYRYSFLNGNYITLTSVNKKDMDRICELQLSPLYISVHATDAEVRKKMLSNGRAGNILFQLHDLARGGIGFHTQLVICPGINDGLILEKSIVDLLSFTEHCLSIAVVPVGLTKYSNPALSPLTRSQAHSLCEKVKSMSRKDWKKRGKNRLFLADEFFIKADLSIPESAYYEDYPQLENGVGLIRTLLDEWQSLTTNIKKDSAKKRINHGLSAQDSKRALRFLILTSLSAEKYMAPICQELQSLFSHLTIDIRSVPNTFFGERVTVAGLLTARDIMKVIKMTKQSWNGIFIPDVIFNYNGFTLDGFSVKRISKSLGMPVLDVSSVSQVIHHLQNPIYDKYS